MSTDGGSELDAPVSDWGMPSLRGRSSVEGLTLAVVVVGLIWRTTRYAMAFPLWGDEAFLAVNFLTRGFAELTGPLEFKQVAPPAFLWAELLAVRAFGSSEWALRLVPFLSGVAALGLFWRFCRRVATRRTALVAVALFAASFFPVRHAAEVKPYAVDLFVALGIASLGWSVWREPSRARPWWALMAAAAVGVWWSYPAVFSVFGVGCWLLARGVAARSPGLIARAATFALVSAMSWFVMFFVFARAQQGETSWLLSYWSEAFPPLSEPWRLPYWLLKVHTGSMLAYPYGGGDFTATITTLLVVTGIVALGRDAARRPLLWLLLSPLPGAFAAAALHRYPYGGSTRLMLYMAPAICLLAGEGIVALLRSRHLLHGGSVLVAGALGLVPIVGTVCDVAMPYHRSADLEYRAFVRGLASQTAPGDQWVVFDGVGTLPNGSWVMSSMWVQRVAKLRFYVLSLAPVPTHWARSEAAPPPSAPGRTWLIVHDHGLRSIYPHVARGAYESALARQLGPPRSTRRSLPVGSTVDVHLHDTPPGIATAPEPNTRVR